MPEPTDNLTLSTLPWTGERMVPCASDIATEMFHWQRYLFFRPWYVNAKVIDAASGEGYGTGYAATFAESALGYDLSDEAVGHASKRYDHAKFDVRDVCEADYSDADLVLSFETIEHLPDPRAFLKALSTCKGRIVISTPNRNTHSPGNKLEDKPLNKFHTVEWTPAEFAELIRECFPDRAVRFLNQEAILPGLIREGFQEDAMYCIAVIGEGELPKWPRLGFAIPTFNNWNQLSAAIQTSCRTYPGEIRFAITANGCDAQTLKALRNQEELTPKLVHIIEESENRGYGVGANLALDFLQAEGGYDYYAVSNDDVLPATDCICSLVGSMRELERQGLKPGAVGPVSNSVSGAQQVDIGPFTDLATLAYRAEQYHKLNHASVNQTLQLRGLFMLLHPDCLRDVGGFDPIFGIGNFEDDDHNLRCAHLGYTLWIAAGAFLYHHGSTTFKRIGIDYQANITRNAALMARKWGLERVEQWIELHPKPDAVDLYVPLTSRPPQDGFEVEINGEMVDLIHRATELEFAGWVLHRMHSQPAELRRAVVQVLEGNRAA
ncbi:MAG TPA: methyltransferase domain-containing protein [Fimbriimonas sp.]|nr:methyltransferase domain-containing protein [Fimbriimonas sp.]